MIKAAHALSDAYIFICLLNVLEYKITSDINSNTILKATEQCDLAALKDTMEIVKIALHCAHNVYNLRSIPLESCLGISVSQELTV